MKVISKVEIGSSNGQQERPTYQQIIANDKIQPPTDMLKSADRDLGVESIDRDRYISPEFHRLELDRMWSKVWQFACREEEIPEVGDATVYELADYSFIIVRSAKNEIKAYYNSCLHRGTKLCTTDANLQHIRCPFHGFTWGLDGQLTEVPCRWDFPQIKDEEFRLPEAKVATWAGFVFINMDLDAMPLEEYLEDLPAQMRERHQEELYIAAYGRHIVPANWKAALESFIEAYHIPELHSQTWKYQGADTTQYDIFPHWKHMNRSLQPIGYPTLEGQERVSEQEVFDTWYKVVRGDNPPTLPPGVSAREAIAEMVRTYQGKLSGKDFSNISVAESIDVVQYLLFPNMIMFRGISMPSHSIYRFRPNKNDPDSCIFDLIVLRPIPPGQQRPEPAKPMDMTKVPYSDGALLPGWLGNVYDQDMENLYNLQQGLKANRHSKIVLSKYQEVRIRHFEQTLTSYIENK
ncbi:MAG: aromatic ring-hydroxylating dioxygenase subunit alpha [Blastocatellia bacterium]|nr:aromatic ring-hydroxylating dioxygenase subunit alpha [Blastocatellia bacterium]